MKNRNFVRNIISAVCLVSLTASLNACGRAELPVYSSVPQQYTAFANINQIQNAQKDQILVKFKKRISSVTANEFNAKYGIKTLKVIPGIDVHVVEASSEVGINAEQLVKYLSSDPLVKYAEINGTIDIDPGVIKVNPIFATLKAENYQKMVGRKVALNGVYRSSRSGAFIQVNNEVKLSIVDLDGTVMTSLPKMTDGTKVTIYGVIKEVKGFNITENIGIMPVTLNTK